MPITAIPVRDPVMRTKPHQQQTQNFGHQGPSPASPTPIFSVLESVRATSAGGADVRPNLAHSGQCREGPGRYRT